MVSSVISRLNDRRDAAADLGEDAGFTLIELMVVLLILAILLAIAIPTFLGVTGGANDKAAQSNLNTALTTAKTAETQNGQSYTILGGGTADITAASLGGLEPSISFVSGATTTQGAVSVWVDPNGNGIILASPSKNGGACWYAVDNVQPVTASTTGANGLYRVVGADITSTTSAPTTAGTFYGYSKSTCDASTTAAPAGLKWNTSFTTVG